VPRVSYTQTFKTAGEVEKFPELKLRTGERSRGWLPDEPWMEWYHRIEAPLVADGEVQMEIKETRRGPVEVQKMDWIASAFCVGLTGTPDSPGPLILEGIDPANCPVCESAANATGVKPPEQRFAAPIIKYKVKGRGQNPYALIEPTTAEVLVWAYTSRQHGMLHDLAAREEMDLRKLDITIDLEDTSGADTYQKIKSLAAIRQPAWRDPAVKEYIRRLWANEENRPTDEQLRVACKGRDYARPVLMDMVRRAERQWRDSERGGGSGGDLGAADAGFNGSLDEGIGALLGEGPPGDGHGADPLSPAEEPAQNITPGVAEDPFADETPDVAGATTTGTSAPAAESPSRTEPESVPSADSSEEPQDAAREQAVADAADGMFGEPAGDSAPPEPARTGNGRRHKAKAEEPAPEPTPDPEPAAVPAGNSGGVIDFDDLFSD
jgi:hypothetical protein